MKTPETTRRLCEWCSNEYEYTRTGPGQAPRYCSPTCKADAERSLAARRMERMRDRKAGGRRGPVGRPKTR